MRLQLEANMKQIEPFAGTTFAVSILETPTRELDVLAGWQSWAGGPCSHGLPPSQDATYLGLAKGILAAGLELTCRDTLHVSQVLLFSIAASNLL